MLPNYGRNNATLFSGGEKNREGHVEGEEEEEKGKLRFSKSWTVLRNLWFALGAWFPRHPRPLPSLKMLDPKVFYVPLSLACLLLHN